MITTPITVQKPSLEGCFYHVEMSLCNSEYINVNNISKSLTSLMKSLKSFFSWFLYSLPTLAEFLVGNVI